MQPCTPDSSDSVSTVATVDIPQANRVEIVRRVVEVMAAGVHDTPEIGRHVRLSHRHASYYMHAARILGWVRMRAGTAELTESGHGLLHTKRGSRTERHCVESAISNSPELQQAVGNLLDDGMNRENLEERLVHSAGLSGATAARRASTLLKWREFVLGRTRRRRSRRTVRAKQSKGAAPGTISVRPPQEREAAVRATGHTAHPHHGVENEVEAALLAVLTAPESQGVLAWIAWRPLSELTALHAASASDSPPTVAPSETVLQQLRKRRRPTPKLRRALRFLNASLPTSESDAIAALVAEELLRPGTSLCALARAAAVMGFRVAFVRHPADPAYLLPATNLTALKARPPQEAPQEEGEQDAISAESV